MCPGVGVPTHPCPGAPPQVRKQEAAPAADWGPPTRLVTTTELGAAPPLKGSGAGGEGRPPPGGSYTEYFSVHGGGAP